MRTTVLLLALAVLAPLSAAAGVFRCQDAAGKVAYQSEPCDERSRQSEVRLRDDAPDPAAPPRVSAWKGYAPPKVAALAFYYDPAQEPVGFSTEQMEANIRKAMATWMAGCEVRLAYIGRRPTHLPATPDAVPIRWAPEFMYDQRHPADGVSIIAGMGGPSYGIAVRPRFRDADMLSVLVHEMGHVLGLPHNHEDTKSVMSYLRDEATRSNPQPSPGDYRDCNVSMQKMFGVEYKPTADAPPPRASAPMTDREALEKMRGAPSRQPQ